MLKYIYVMQKTKIYRNRIFKQLKSIPVIRRLWKTAGVEIHYFEKVTIHPFTTCKSYWFCLTYLISLCSFS